MYQTFKVFLRLFLNNQSSKPLDLVAFPTQLRLLSPSL